MGETLDPRRRLLAPEIGNRQTNWDEALDLVADKFSSAIRDHGPDSVAFYVSGANVERGLLRRQQTDERFFGSANIDTNSRLCMASSVAGHKRAFGADTVPGNYEDLELADVIVSGRFEHGMVSSGLVSAHSSPRKSCVPT